MNYLTTSQSIIKVKYFLNEHRHILTSNEIKRNKELLKLKNKAFLNSN